MSIQIAGSQLDKIKIIDDDPGNREVWSYPVEELHLIADPVEGPIVNLDELIAELKVHDYGAICDHHLKTKKYSNYDGAEIVSGFTQSGVSSILVTRYEDRIEELRRYRKYIPVLLNPDDLDPDAIAHGLELCAQEIKGFVSQSRKLRRTLIRVEGKYTEISESNPYIEISIPSWNPSAVYRILLSELPKNIHDVLKPDMRFHAHVNIGAENFEELYFDRWEVD